ncbi:DUF2254 domain-containing protein [Leptolyngbya sp. AN03gr2]|uniref:DUF2254 domain-containing protein n=1 Tax=unclassified Leptolyngbya TaxID=2650499 RepID=UPI003D313845
MKNTKLSKYWDTLLSSYWFLPSLILIAAIALALTMLYLDRTGKPGITNLWWLYTGGPDGARSALSAIAGSVITVAGTAFSITIVALQLAASNFGPRLLRTFMKDIGNQIVLGILIGTFIYCVLILRTIRGENYSPFVPQMSVTVGVVLAVLSTGVLVYFIHHASTIIQVSQVITNVSDDLDRAIDRLFPERIGQSLPDAPRQITEIPHEFEQRSASIKATQKGYLQAIDQEKLMKVACRADVLLCLKTRPGKYGVPGTPLVLVYPPEYNSEKLAQQIKQAFIFGKERTEQQDIAFPIEQLVEIALRAISPAVNDPFTAIRCIDRLSAGLSQLAQRTFPSPYRYDDQHTLRIIAEPTTFEFLVDRAFNQIRQYAQSDAAVTIRLLEAIALIATYTKTPKQRTALRHHADMIRRGSQTGLTEECDRKDVEQHYQQALAALDPKDTKFELRQL